MTKAAADFANDRTMNHPRRASGELVWIDLPNGQVKCVSHPAWQARYHDDEVKRAEEDRQKFNHRQRNPVGE